jgi:predicted ribosomally synthesized peptide with SipW-like signal peptide
VRRALAAVVAVLVALAGPAYAAWSDPVTVDSGTIAATTVVDPASVTCSIGGLNTLDFTWQHVDLKYDYVVTVERLNGTVVDTRVVTPSGGVGSNQQVQLSLGVLGSLLSISSTFVVRVVSRFASTSWVSSPGATDTGSFTLGVLVSC